MRKLAEKSHGPQRRASIGAFVSYGLVIGAVILGWQMAIQPMLQRVPVETAIRLAPGSPLVLRRAAESELAAGRADNAAALSKDALVRSPFDARALRVVGLAEASAGRTDQADDILTLAGNWSLRDDPAHAWLVEHRLRNGDYGSAFAHADTLVRRRQDIQPQVFRLFTLAGTEDPQRALPEIARLLTERPSWRSQYFLSLTTPQELQLFGSLAILLESGSAPLAKGELERLNSVLLDRRDFEAITVIRARTNRPPIDVPVTNSSFSDPEAPQPFQWRYHQKAGIGAEIADDDLRPSNSALRVDYDGYASGTVAEQLTSLEPGSYRFTAEVRTEVGDPGSRLVWTFSCATGGEALASIPAGATNPTAGAWTTLSGDVEIPDRCPAQWLKLETRAGDRRSPTVVWFDRLSVSPHS